MMLTPGRMLRALRRTAPKYKSFGFFGTGGILGVTNTDKIGASNQLLEFDESQLGHFFADFFRQKEEIIDDVFRLTCKFLTQDRILSRDSNRARVQMTFPHHRAT